MIEGKVFEVLEYAVRYDGRMRPVTCFESERIGATRRWLESEEVPDWRSEGHTRRLEVSKPLDWSEKWRTERKIIDLDARLELYRYGDRHLQPEKMQAVTANRLRDAFAAHLAIGITAPEKPKPCWGEWAVGNTWWPDTDAPRGSAEERPSSKEQASP
jgi:hypothetical protein